MILPTVLVSSKDTNNTWPCHETSKFSCFVSLVGMSSFIKKPGGPSTDIGLEIKNSFEILIYKNYFGGNLGLKFIIYKLIDSMKRG